MIGDFPRYDMIKFVTGGALKNRKSFFFFNFWVQNIKNTNKDTKEDIHDFLAGFLLFFAFSAAHLKKLPRCTIFPYPQEASFAKPRQKVNFVTKGQSNTLFRFHCGKFLYTRKRTARRVLN